MKYIKLFISFIAIFLLTGCWNYRELNKISLVSAIGVDVSGDEYIVSVSIVNSKKVAGSSQSSGSSSEESPTTVYEYKAKTIKDALNNMIFEAPHQLYTGHIRLLAIGEEAAKKGIYSYLDFFMADTEIRKIFPVIVVEGGKAIDALRITLPLETITPEHIYSSLETDSEITSYLSNRKFDEILNCLYMEGRHLTISSAKIVGSPSEGEKTDNISSSLTKNSIKITGSAVFKEDKLVGYLHDLDSLGYNILRGLTKSTVIEFPCDSLNNYGAIIIDNLKGSIKLTLKKDKPFYKINIVGKASIPEYNCKNNWMKDPINSIKKVEKMANKELEIIVNNTLIKLQKELKSDIVGFGEMIYKNQNKYWKKIKNDWDNIFPAVKYTIDSKIHLESIDTTIKPAKEGN